MEEQHPVTWPTPDAITEKVLVVIQLDREAYRARYNVAVSTDHL